MGIFPLGPAQFRRVQTCVKGSWPGRTDRPKSLKIEGQGPEQWNMDRGPKPILWQEGCSGPKERVQTPRCLKKHDETTSRHEEYRCPQRVKGHQKSREGAAPTRSQLRQSYTIGEPEYRPYEVSVTDSPSTDKTPGIRREMMAGDAEMLTQVQNNDDRQRCVP